MVDAVAPVLVLVIVKSFVEPLAFTLPSMLTLSAPFKLSNGPATLPPVSYTHLTLPTKRIV